MTDKITQRLISIFTDYSSDIKSFEDLLKVDMTNLSKEKKLELGGRVDNLKAKSIQFYTLCTLVKDDLGLELKDIMPEIEELYNLQLRSKDARLPEDDEGIVKFKEFLKKK